MAVIYMAVIDGSVGQDAGSPGRGATIEGSRGFQPTDCGIMEPARRGATPEAVRRQQPHHGFMRRAATRVFPCTANRGLKP
jgi:hypothetical protein